MEIIYQQMLPRTPLSAELPDWVKLNIADCIVVFGRLEQTVIEIAWEVAGTTEIKERLKRARQPANNNFDEVLGIVEEVAGTKFDALRTAFDGLSKDSNLIAHGSWLMAGENALVDLRNGNAHADGFVIAKIVNLARAVAVVSAKPST